ncbi:DUF72 domain-containing protein [Haloechinothrix salitolerans]
MTEIRVGTSGWVYDSWRGTFYPDDLPRKRELEYLSRQLRTAELNGSFYSLQRPDRYRGWRDAVPDDFVFAVKGSRFITHMKQLRNIETPLANFLASGVLALGPTLGPMLWQLPPRMTFDVDRLTGFFASLPRSTAEAAELARGHDDKLKAEPFTEVDVDRPIRHALEVRHPSFATAECVELLREHDIALCVADSAGEWPHLEDVTSDFVYVRLHGDVELYTSGYSDTVLREWANKIRQWRDGGGPRGEHTVGPPAPRRRRDVYVYFDNDVEAYAPRDAMALADLLDASPR